MKLKEFIEIVTDRSSSTGRIGPVPLDLTRNELAELRAECSFLGWNPIPVISMPAVGLPFDFGPARITLVESETSNAPNLSKWWHIHPNNKPLAYVVNRIQTHVDLDARVHGTEPESIEITKTPDGWQAIGYGKPRNTGAVEAGVAEDQDQAEMLAEAAKRVAVSEDGHFVSVNVVGAIDDVVAATLAEKIKRHAAEQVSAGYDEPGEETSIWQEIRDRIEEAVENGSPSDALRWLEVAERLTQSPRPLGFQD